MGFIEWWYELPTIVRVCVSLIMLGISTAMLLAGRIWIWGWVMGGVLLMFCGAGNNKDGYNF